MTKTLVKLDTIAEAVELACRAPSIHNSQPWRWVVSGSVVNLFVDPARVIRSHDASCREAIMSCGAALDHFRVAMAASGWATEIEHFPDPDDLAHLASIGFNALESVPPVWRAGRDAISRRRTDRLPFRTPRDWESFEPVLRGAVDSRLVMLHVLADTAIPQLTEAARLVDTVRHEDDRYHRELQWWTAPFRVDEGVPDTSLVSRSERERVGIGRSFPLRGHGDRRSATTQDEATVLVLSTPEDNADDALNCGRVLSTVLLDCTMAGLATCTLTHVTELAESRDIIRDLLGTSTFPQALIRVGSVSTLEPTPIPTPRRPLFDVLEIHGGDGLAHG